MAHEITNTDGMVLAGKQAWHGLGTVVEEAPTPYQALHLAGINWNVIEAPLSATTFTTDDDGMETPVRVQVPDRKCLLRDDTNEVLGIVSERYEVIQNREIADLIYEVATDDEITVESAGSLAGGKRIFFLCHLGTFGLDHGDDTVKPTPRRWRFPRIEESASGTAATSGPTSFTCRPRSETSRPRPSSSSCLPRRR
jgi:hypothetical protein